MGLDTSRAKNQPATFMRSRMTMEIRRGIRNARRTAAMAPGLALWCALHAAVAAQAPNDAADAGRLIDVLQLHAGAVVADVGAGSGLLTVPVARAVGPTGRVYATDVNAQRLEELKKAASDATLQNIVVLAG